MNDTKDYLDEQLKNFKKLKEDAPTDSKDLLGNIERGMEIVKAGYLIMDTVGSVIDFFKGKKK